MLLKSYPPISGKGWCRLMRLHQATAANDRRENRARLVGAAASRHRLARCGSLHVARDPTRIGLLTYVLKQCTTIRIDQEEFENVIDRSIGFALSNHVESRPHVFDLFGRSSQEQPAANLSALRVRIRE